MPTTEPPRHLSHGEPAVATQSGSLLSGGKPLALVVFLENVGHVASLRLPRWVTASIDFVTEEYAKVLLRTYGAYSHYDRINILEDEHATGPELADALLAASRTHTVDVLLLVHGHAGVLVGHRGRHFVGAETFDALRARRNADPAALNLRMVYGCLLYTSPSPRD